MNKIFFNSFNTLTLQLNKIFLQAMESQSMQPKSMKNRLNKFRMKLGAIQTKHTQKKKQEQMTADSPIKIRLRKASINLKNFDNVDLKKQTSIKQTFQDHYELQQKIGEGGHSVVYKCKKNTDGKIYAVKFTRKNDPQNLQNLKQQYRILMSLDHKSIMKGYYLFLNEKKCTCHFICQYLDFFNLKQFLVQKYQNGMPEQLTAQILINILIAVQYLHSQNVCHRDLKSDNILCNIQTLQIKIIDFDVAKMTRYKHEKLQMWTKTGTPQYRSPQLYQGSYTQTTDLWSIGIIAFELLTGKLPFSGLYDNDLVKAICQKEPNYSELHLSNLALSFLKKLLTKDPELRMTAKEALSHPFLLTMGRNCQSPHRINDKLNNSFEDQVQQQKIEFTKSKFYDQNVQFSFLGNTGKDIGIINCEEQ